MEDPPAQPAAEAPPEASSPGGFMPAGFWVRGGAMVLDVTALFILGMLLVALNVPGGSAVGVLLGLAYKTFFVSHGGQTPGKMAAGIKVVSAAGEAVSAPRALARAALEYASGLTLMIGYMIAALPAKRALHDYAAGTRVVYVEGVGAGRKAAFAALGVILPLGIMALSLFLGGSLGKFKDLHDKSGEGATKANLGTLRSLVSIKYADLEGEYPHTLEAALIADLLKAIPETSLKDHPKTASWTAYDGEVCLPGLGQYGSVIDHTKIKDTGGWGYVTDPQARCWGAVFVDCSHKDTKGKFWPEY